MLRLYFALGGCLVVFSQVTATSLQPSAAPGPWPGARSGAHAMAFDERRGLTMLYGDRGADASTLWAWDGRQWRAFVGSGPGLRRHIKLVYDRARDRLVMYGGYDDAGLEIRSDTWEWDGRQWLRIEAPGPGPRSSYSLLYDPQRKKVILFGGLSPEGARADTWTWDGKAWTKIADGGPSPRGEAGIVFDRHSRRPLLSGGMTYGVRTLANGRTTLTLQRDQMPPDTWTLDGTTWRLASDTGTPHMGPIVSDPRSGASLRIAGESADGKLLGNLWQWAGGAWRVIPGAEIPARHGAAAALDSWRKRLVVFGGSVDGGKPQSDLWEWDGRRWSQIGPAISASTGVAAQDAPAPRPLAVYSVGAAFDAARGRLVVFGGFGRGGYIGDTWEWDGATWTRFAGSGPPARNAPAMVYDATRRVIVMFGGDTKQTGSLADTWTFDGAAWRQAPGSDAAPPARTTHAMVYDARRQRVVLFGGSDGPKLLGDTWEWDGSRWTQRSSEGPSARTLYGLAYDSARGRTVMFGGMSVFAPDAPSHGDTWEWDGTRWTQVMVSGPSPRDHVAMDYDAARQAVVMHGGGLGDSAPGETWTFDGRAWTPLAPTGPRRRFARLAFDPRTRTMLLFGGFDRQPSSEVWRLSGAAWTRVDPK